jgi:hypothetical protein
VNDKEQGAAGSGELSPRIFDEDFAAAARFREPSAAERARRGSRLARRRAAREARRLGLTGRQPPRLRRVVMFSLTLLLLAGVVGGAGWVLLTDLRHPLQPAVRKPAARPAMSAPASISSSPVLAPDAFAGSPAEGYQDGAAGIQPPAPAPVGAYSQAQVSAAYATTRRLLLAAHLDRATLLGGTPAALARLLTPGQRSYLLHHLNDGSNSSRGMVTTFAPGSVQFTTDVIKVHGRMSASAATDSHGEPVLRVKTDYLYVYAIQPPGLPAESMRVVVRGTDQVDFAPWEDPRGPLLPWWYPDSNVAGTCDFQGGFIHPDFPLSSGPGKAHPSGRPVNPYDQSVPPPKGDHCRLTTGT